MQTGRNNENIPRYINRRTRLCSVYPASTSGLADNRPDPVHPVNGEMRMYSSKQILAMEDLYDLQEKAWNKGISYQLTKDEIGWLDFIRGKYSIVDYLDERINDDGVLNIAPDEVQDLSVCLDDDCSGFGKAVMLSDDTALQKIFFWLYSETED